MSTSTSDAKGIRGRSIEIDDGRWPLVIITFRGTATDAEFDAYLAEQTRLAERCEKNAVVVDATEAGPTPALQRKKVVAWMSRNEWLIEGCTLGTSFAIRSPIVRGALTAILWMQPLSHPHHVAATVGEAERWAIERLRLAGLTAPPALATAHLG